MDAALMDRLFRVSKLTNKIDREVYDFEEDREMPLYPLI